MYSLETRNAAKNHEGGWLSLFPPADKRQDEIWEYTCEQWGEAQAKKYIQGLHDPLQGLASKKIMWKPLPASLVVPSDVKTEVYFSRYEKHDIFFRKLPRNVIGVMSILHISMQIPVRLQEDLEKIPDTKKRSQRDSDRGCRQAFPFIRLSQRRREPRIKS